MGRCLHFHLLNPVTLTKGQRIRREMTVEMIPFWGPFCQHLHMEVNKNKMKKKKKKKKTCILKRTKLLQLLPKIWSFFIHTWSNASRRRGRNLCCRLKMRPNVINNCVRLAPKDRRRVGGRRGGGGRDGSASWSGENGFRTKNKMKKGKEQT